MGISFTTSAGKWLSRPVIGTAKPVPPNQFQPVCQPITPQIEFERRTQAQAKIEKMKVIATIISGKIHGPQDII